MYMDTFGIITFQIWKLSGTQTAIGTLYQAHKAGENMPLHEEPGQECFELVDICLGSTLSTTSCRLLPRDSSIRG